jgi:uncharacterized protein with von Willebrand factor type A (vWA) domain
MTATAVTPLELDLPALAAAFGRRLHEAGVPVTAERSARFAEALALTRPVARRRLYWTARTVLVSDAAQIRAFDAVFHEVFGSRLLEPDEVADDTRQTPPDERPATPRSGEGDVPGGAAPAPAGDGEAEREAVVPVAASDEERLRGKRFDALEPGELAQLYALMAQLRITTP